MSFQILKKLDLLLGIVPKTKYQEYKINFDQSSMYIFTDGITEIKNLQKVKSLVQLVFKIILLNIKINLITKD